MKSTISGNLFFASIYFFAMQTNAQLPDLTGDSLSRLIMNKIEYVGVNKLVQYEKVNEGKAFYEERTLDKNRLLDTVFIRNDSLITKYKEDHIDWKYYGGKKYKNLYDPPGYMSAAIIDLKLSIAYIKQESFQGASLSGYAGIIWVVPKNKQYAATEFPYTSLNFTGHAFNRRYTNKNAKELNDVNAVISLFSLYVLQIYNKKLETFKTSANKQNKSAGISEGQRKLIVQANLANEEKQYEKALELYEESLKLNEYNYPQAYYNMALIAAQLGDYAVAIFNMKKYLILSPEAEDARKAQDKIYEWEFKLDNN